MSYIALARKYRPQNFDEVIGQEHVTLTLKNAISKDRVSHAYLFTGPRGVGKTSTARIMAKGLNCAKGPTDKPCGKCASCLDIIAGRSLDVIEIDGASNRGIDDIRTLRENVKFAPSSGKFKVYIIDEVHMLTAEAFNALLKTLEEPPAHVKFIFATTQPHKVLSTILSRCQRFDFRLIPSTTLVDTLKAITEKEKITINDDALFGIVKAACGSMRDAQVILDQLSSFTKGKIQYDDVVQVLGLIGEKSLLEFADEIIEKRTEACLKRLDTIINEGKDPVQLCWDLITQFRNLLVAKTGSQLRDLIDLPDDDIKAIYKQSESLKVDEILYMFSILTHTQDVMKRSLAPRTMLEVALIKICLRGETVAAGELINKLKDLENKITAATSIPTQKKSEVPAVTPVSVPALANDVSFEEVVRVWPTLIKRMKNHKMSIASYLMESNPLKVEEEVLTIAFPDQYKFHKETVECKENKDLIDGILTELLGGRVRTEYALVKAAEGEELEAEEGRKEALIDPIVQSAVEMFDGRVRRSL